MDKRKIRNEYKTAQTELKEVLSKVVKQIANPNKTLNVEDIRLACCFLREVLKLFGGQ